MNKSQFKIVKSMQGIGVEATKFAKATSTPAMTMMKAYSSNNYEQFTNAKDDPMQQFNDLFGGSIF